MALLKNVSFKVIMNSLLRISGSKAEISDMCDNSHANSNAAFPNTSPYTPVGARR